MTQPNNAALPLRLPRSVTCGICGRLLWRGPFGCRGGNWRRDAERTSGSWNRSIADVIRDTNGES